MNRDLTRELKGDAYTIAFDRRDPNNTDGVVRVSDDNFFAFPARDDQHPCYPLARRYETACPLSATG